MSAPGVQGSGSVLPSGLVHTRQPLRTRRAARPPPIRSGRVFQNSTAGATHPCRARRRRKPQQLALSLSHNVLSTGHGARFKVVPRSSWDSRSHAGACGVPMST